MSPCIIVIPFVNPIADSLVLTEALLDLQSQVQGSKNNIDPIDKEH